MSNNGHFWDLFEHDCSWDGRPRRLHVGELISDLDNDNSLSQGLLRHWFQDVHVFSLPQVLVSWICLAWLGHRGGRGTSWSGHLEGCSSSKRRCHVDRKLFSLCFLWSHTSVEILRTLTSSPRHECLITAPRRELETAWRALYKGTSRSHPRASLFSPRPSEVPPQYLTFDPISCDFLAHYALIRSTFPPQKVVSGPTPGQPDHSAPSPTCSNWLILRFVLAK